jgi:hypothetical protein
VGTFPCKTADAVPCIDSFKGSMLVKRVGVEGCGGSGCGSPFDGTESKFPISETAVTGSDVVAEEVVHRVRPNGTAKAAAGGDESAEVRWGGVEARRGGPCDETNGGRISTFEIVAATVPLSVDVVN